MNIRGWRPVKEGPLLLRGQSVGEAVLDASLPDLIGCVRRGDKEQANSARALGFLGHPCGS